MDEKKLEMDVNKTTLRGVSKGWMEPQGVSVKDYLKLPYEARKDIKIKITEKGKKHVETDDFLNLFSNQTKLNMMKNSNKMGDYLIKNVEMDEATGEVQMELTEEGVKAKALANAMGLDFTEHLKNLLSDGLNNQLAEFLIIPKGKKVLDGNTRMENAPGYELSDDIVKKLKEEGVLDE